LRRFVGSPIFRIHPIAQRASLISLRGAGTYITKIPKAEHDTPACKQPIMEGRLNLHSSA
jgi:hypothetical protein